MERQELEKAGVDYAAGLEHFVENAHTVNNFDNLVDNIPHMSNPHIVHAHSEIHLYKNIFESSHIKAYLSLQHTFFNYTTFFHILIVFFNCTYI